MKSMMKRIICISYQGRILSSDARASRVTLRTFRPCSMARETPPFLLNGEQDVELPRVISARPVVGALCVLHMLQKYFMASLRISCSVFSWYSDTFPISDPSPHFMSRYLLRPIKSNLSINILECGSIPWNLFNLLSITCLK